METVSSLILTADFSCLYYNLSFQMTVPGFVHVSEEL